MVSFKFKTLARAALATAMVVGAQFASAQVAAGDVIQLSKANNNDISGGAFNASVVSGPNSGASFVTFCLEKTEYVTMNTNAFVGGVTDHTVSASGSPDFLSAETAWLFTQYSNNVAGFTINSTTTNAAMQNAFWYLEGEVALNALDSTAQSWVTQAQNAVSSHAWTGTGNAKVINLYTDANHSSHAQDQLVMMAPVPEPETYAMLLAGLGVMGMVARRRNKKSAA